MFREFKFGVQLRLTGRVGETRWPPRFSTAKSKLPEMSCTFLTQDERYQMAILLEAGYDQRGVVRVMSRHKSSISRALRRNRVGAAAGPSRENDES
jgi:IS30 family transposase